MIFFINNQDIPHDKYKDTTYARFVHKMQSQKEKHKRMQLAIGGNCINHPGEVGKIGGHVVSETDAV